MPKLNKSNHLHQMLTMPQLFIHKGSNQDKTLKTNIPFNFTQGYIYARTLVSIFFSNYINRNIRLQIFFTHLKIACAYEITFQSPHTFFIKCSVCSINLFNTLQPPLNTSPLFRKPRTSAPSLSTVSFICQQQQH